MSVHRILTMLWNWSSYDPISQMKKLKFREVKKFATGHTVGSVGAMAKLTSV